MKRQILLILLGKLCPTFLAYGLTAYFGLAEFGELRLYLSQAYLVMGLVTAGFVPAFVAFERFYGQGKPSVAWTFLLIMALSATGLMLAILKPVHTLTSLLVIVVVFLSIVAESSAVINRRPAISALVSLIGGSLLYLAFWVIRPFTEGAVIATFLSALISTTGLVALNLYIYRTRPKLKSHADSSVTLIRWAKWQFQFIFGPGVARLYINLIPVVLGYVSGPEAVSVVTLAVATGTIFSFIPTRFLQINLGLFINLSAGNLYELNDKFIDRLRYVRLFSVISGTLVLLILASGQYWMSYQIGIFEHILTAICFLAYPLINIMIGPAGTILAQIGYQRAVQTNAIISGVLFVFLVSLTAFYASENVFFYGAIYLLVRTLNDLLNLKILQNKQNGTIDLSIVPRRK